MSRYIDADKIFYDALCWDITCEECPFCKDGLCLLMHRINDIPTADVAEIKHGYWVDDNNGRTYINGERVKTKLCNHCGCANLFNIVGDPIYSNSCPNCGAEMDKVTI